MANPVSESDDSFDAKLEEMKGIVKKLAKDVTNSLGP